MTCKPNKGNLGCISIWKAKNAKQIVILADEGHEEISTEAEFMEKLLILVSTRFNERKNPTNYLANPKRIINTEFVDFFKCIHIKTLFVRFTYNDC